MANVRQNIYSTKPVLTLEQKIAIKKQNKFAQYCLNEYVKDKNRKAKKEAERLVKENAKAEKLAAKQIQQKAATVAEIQPEKKRETKEKTWQVPFEVLRALFEANRMSLLPLYLTATRHKSFLGTVTKSKVEDLAKCLKRNPNTVMRQLSQLQGEGLCKRTGNVWMFIGGKKVTALCGKTMVKLVKVQSLDRKYLTTLAYAAFISDQGKRIFSKAKSKNASLSVDGVKVPIAAKFTANWIGRSRVTVSARRKAAKGFGMIDYQRQFKHHHTGGIEVKNGFVMARSSKLTRPSEILVEKNGCFSWIEETPSHFSNLLHFTLHPVKSKALRQLARQRHQVK